jgi:hypothetical protein
MMSTEYQRMLADLDLTPADLTPAERDALAWLAGRGWRVERDDTDDVISGR